MYHAYLTSFHVIITSMQGLNDIYMGDDGLPFSTLAYMNGPGAPQVHEAFNKTGKRPDLTNVDTGNVL